MAQHDLACEPSTVHWGYFDAALKPVLSIDSGDRLLVHTLSGSPADLPPSGGATIQPALPHIHAAVIPDLGPHILTGPVAVRGAAPGDALRISILDIALADDWGFNIIRPGRGALPDDFPEGGTVHFEIERQAKRVHTPWGMVIEARPFFGIIGLAPAPSLGRITSVAPGSFGGNIDNKELVAGTVLTLPVAVAGGLLSVGDGHAAQGDGEVCLTAVETGLTGTLQIDLVKDAHLEAPVIETPTHLIAMAFDEDLDEAVKVALRRMIAMVSQRSGLTADQAYRLCSIAAGLHVTQVVNVRKGIHMMMPLALLDQMRG